MKRDLKKEDQEKIDAIIEEDIHRILPEKPKDPMKGMGHRREIVRVKGQKLRPEVIKHFFRCVPDNHKEQMRINKVDRKLISPEAWYLYQLYIEHDCNPDTDYKELFLFKYL